jgi:hypothetical protein
MKLQKLYKKQKKFNKKTAREDLKYLQKKIYGRSVYMYVKGAYCRSPKHKNRQFSY